jgi:hypothetical protein
VTECTQLNDFVAPVSLEEQALEFDRRGTQRDQFADLTIDTQCESLMRDGEQSQCAGSSISGEIYEQTSPRVSKIPAGVRGACFLNELMRADL